MQIKQLFDPARDIYRPIEKVIAYQAAQQARLKAEISEYIFTASIEEQFEDLLEKMQLAMDAGGGNDIGVWVSGFYGSGKSSFTKYLGLALDDQVEIDGARFLTHLQGRMQRPQSRALLTAVASRFPAAVVFLDLASEMLAGATMEEVSSVLYYKVLQWAGYSRNLKVAALERKLQQDGRYQAFCERVLSMLKVPWESVQNDTLVIDSVVPTLAHEFYPAMFPSEHSFTTETAEVVRFENERVAEMIEIVRQKSGKEYVLFIIDEAGQYVGSRPELILNLDGLAKNLKAIGDGKAWILATAQQTLTEDDQRVAFNSPELFKLAARFPIQIDLESRDIKEICVRRLLAKSPAGETALGALFDQHGQALRHNTRLEDARFYDAEFNKDTFVNLYPFLPAHFDILLHLLGALAKSTGGIGLRSAIKIIQDILIESSAAKPAAADQPIGWLATSVTLYDALEKDIRRAFPTIHHAVEKTIQRRPDSELHQRIAKTVAVLQMLGNMPVTRQNVASLMHPTIAADTEQEETRRAIDDLIADPIAPFGEKDGSLCFHSEKINDIDQERAQIPLRSVETLRIRNEAIGKLFDPLPSTRLNDSLVVKAGIKTLSGGLPSSLAGDRETIQIHLTLVHPQEYDEARRSLVDESRLPAAKHVVFLVGRFQPGIDEMIQEIYRCREIVQRHRNDPDQDVRGYCGSQTDRAGKLADELGHNLKSCFAGGSLIFRGETSAVESLDPSLETATKKFLGSIASLVFERNSEAPLRAETALAERFLRISNLQAVTPEVDPLRLVQVSAGAPQIQTNHRALISIKDYLGRFGSVDGKRLSEYFTEAPFGWSQDTLRYLVAGLLLAGEIRLKVSGREITVNGQQAIDALKSNNSFRTVGVALRDERIDNAVLARAAERLTQLVGEPVIPLEAQISKTAARYFGAVQPRMTLLAEKLGRLDLPGGERIRLLNQQLAEALGSDASDAPALLGAEESTFYAALAWGDEVERGLANGLEATLRALQIYRHEIESLPASGIPGKLQDQLAEEFELLRDRLRQDSFLKLGADFNVTRMTIEAAVRAAAIEMQAAIQESIDRAQQDLRLLPGWAMLTHDEQSQQFAALEELAVEAGEGLKDLKALVNQEYMIGSRAAGAKLAVERLGRERQLADLEREKEKADREGLALARTITIPSKTLNKEQVEDLVEELVRIKRELNLYENIAIHIQIKDG